MFYDDINAHKIVKYNIFEHHRFAKDIEKHLKIKDEFEFAEEVRRSLFYYFGFKCEYELNISGLFYSENDKALKVDIYSQVMLNWDRFIEYLWSMRKS